MKSNSQIKKENKDIIILKNSMNYKKKKSNYEVKKKNKNKMI